jgi:hypothetical protein
MPKQDIDYSKGLIYKIVCKDLNVKDLYVGSTTNFEQRKFTHKYACTHPSYKSYNAQVYKFIRDHNGWDNWEMILIQLYPCDSSLALRKKEREIKEQLGATLNEYFPERSNKEYLQTEKMKIYKKQYQQTPEYKAYRKDYKKTNRSTQQSCQECGGHYLPDHKSRHIASKLHQDYLKTGQKRVIQSEQFICQCGVQVTLRNKLRHERSTFHKQNI